MKSITVLKLKLKEVPESLEQIAAWCREARNVASEDWLLRQRGKRESPKQRKKNRKGKDLTESTKLYHAITGAVPQLGSDIASNISQQVSSYLSAKVDWRRGADDNGKRPKRKDAILRREDRPPYFTDKSVPIPNKYTTIHCEDTLTVHVSNMTRSNGDQFPLDFELSLKGLPTGMKRIIHQLKTGEHKLSDSKLVFSRNKWFWFVPVAFESQPLENDREAVLMPVIGEGKYDRPFSVLVPGRRPWYLGEGRYLVSQYQRLVGLRKQIGWRYRQGRGSGHGRKKVDAAIVKRNRQLADICGEVRRQLINDIVKQCERGSCGQLHYREPTNPAKTKCWFDVVGVHFDWTRFLGDLKNSCARRGIAVKVSKLKMGDIDDGEAKDEA